MNVPSSNGSSTSSTADATPTLAGAALRDRLFHLLDAIQSEGEHNPDDDRRLRRWAVQAPVLIGTRRADAPPLIAAGGQQPAEANFPFNRSFELLCHGWATDLCESGIGLLTEQPLPMGEVLHVSLQSLLSEPMLIPIRIAYSRRVLAHTHRAGGSFVFD
ncbi:MAG: hypothetical protein WDZ31_04960 [Phycisphaeraceae bacterium]